MSLITFNGSSSALKKSITGLTPENVDEMVDILMGLKASSTTPYGAAFDRTTQWFEGQPTVDSEGKPYKNLTFFLTDGEPSTEWSYNRDNEFAELAAISDAWHRDRLGRFHVHAEQVRQHRRLLHGRPGNPRQLLRQLERQQRQHLGQGRHRHGDQERQRDAYHGYDCGWPGVQGKP